jgi:DNA-binding transcriptional MerR regulator
MDHVYFLPSDVSKLLRISPDGVRAMEARGRITPAARTVGGVRLYSESEVRRVLEAREHRHEAKQE